VTDQPAWQWQHTRCRIAKVKPRYPEKVEQINPSGDDAWPILYHLYDALTEGYLQSVGVAVVYADRSIATAYTPGTGSIFTLNGALASLITRIEREPMLYQPVS